MNRPLLALLTLAAASGCTPKEGAVRATITLQGAQKASCVVLQVRDVDGAVLTERKLERAVEQGEWVVAIFRGTYPQQVNLSAEPRFGASACADPLFVNGAAVERSATFSNGQVTEVTLALSSPDAASDEDRDGFAGPASGGPDCDDANPSAYPDAAEVCTGGSDLNCNQRVGCADPVCQAQACATPPSALVFTTAAQVLDVGACSAVVVVEARDAGGAALAVTATTPVSLASSSGSGVSFFSDAACSSPTAGITLASGESAASFYFSSPTAGTPTLTATVSGVPSATQQQTLRPGPASRLAFRTAPQVLDAGRCSSVVTLRSEDAFGNASPLAAAKPVSLAAAPAAGSAFYSDPACSLAIGGLEIPAGTSAAGFYFQGSAVGTVELTASAGGLTSGSQEAVIRAGPPSALAFSTPAQVLTVGVCSPQVLLETRDLAGNAVPVTADTPVTVAGPTGVSFFSDSACSNLLPQPLVIPAGEGTAASPGRLYFKGTNPGANPITASASGLTQAAQTHTLVSAGPTTLKVTSAAKTVAAGACSGGLTFRTEDSLGAASNVTTTTVITYSGVPGGALFFNSANCSGGAQTSITLSSGGGGGTFSFRTNTAGPLDLTLSSPALNSATQQQTVNPATVSAIAWAGGPQTVGAGSCSAAATVRSQDAFGNTSPVGADVTVTLGSNSSPAGSFKFYSDGACNVEVPSVLLASGTRSTPQFFFRGTTAASITATATTASLGSANQVQQITPASPQQLSFVSSPQTVAAGACSGAVSARVEDGFGNASNVATSRVVTLGSDAGLTFHPAADCAGGTELTQVTVPAGTSAVPAFYFKGTTAGAAQLGLASTGLTGASQSQTLSAAAAAKVVFTTPTRTAQAGSCVGQPATLQVQDTFGNPVSGARALTLAHDLAVSSNLTFHAGTTCAGGGTTTFNVTAGNSSVDVYFKGIVAGPVGVTASASGLSSGSQTQTVTPAAASVLFFTSAPHAVPALQCSPAVDLQTRDVHGNASPVASATTVTLSHDGGAGFTLYSDSACTQLITSLQVAGGSSTGSFHFRGAAPDPGVQLTAASGGFTSANQTHVVTSGAASRLRFTTAARTFAATGACSQVLTVQLQDAGGNPTSLGSATTVGLGANPATRFAFHDNATCSGAPVTEVALPGGNSDASFYFKGTLAGSVDVTASVASVGSDTQAQTVTAGPPTVLAITSTAQTLTAGACSAPVTVQTRDAEGNPANVTALTALELSVTSAGSAVAGFRFYSDSGCTLEVTTVNVPAGSANAAPFHFVGEVAGTMDVAVANAAFTSATQAQLINPGSADALRFVAASGQTVSPSFCSQPVQVEAVDVFGNRAPGARTVNLSANPAAGFTFHAGAGCGTPAVNEVSMPSTGLASFYFKGTTAGVVEVTIASGALAAAAQAQTIGKLVQSGVCTLADTSSSGACTLGTPLVALERSILFYQAVTSGAEAKPVDTAVLCTLSSTSQATCTRAGTTGNVQVVYYVVEFPSGVTVNRSPEIACSNGTTSLDYLLNPAVDPSSSFVLLSSRRGGNNNVDSVFSSAVLSSSGDKVTLVNVGGCASSQVYELQVVTFPGATVTRGLTDLPASSLTATVTGQPAVDLGRSLLLYSPRPSATSTNNVLCERMVRGRLDSTSAFTFSRGAGAAAATCANVEVKIQWERVQLPVGNVVQAVDFLNVGTSQTSSTGINAVDLARAVAFTGAHGSSGQGGGETAQSTTQVMGEGRARHVLTSGGAALTLFRGPANPTQNASFSSYVVEFATPQ